MKQMRFWAMLIAFIGMGMTFTSCSDDEKDDDLYNSSDYGAAVAGVYAGKLTSGGYVIDDAYIVTITRISNTVVKMNADFFDNSVNFNVSYANGIYNLTNADYSDENITVLNKTLSIVFRNAAGSNTMFNGVRD